MHSIGGQRAEKLCDTVRIVAGDMSFPGLCTYLECEGGTAEAYKELVSDQVEGLTVAKGPAERTRNSVNDSVEAIEAEQTAIRQKITDLGGEWTRSSVDLGDATTSDGDVSNWKVN